MKKSKLIFSWVLRILTSLGFLLASTGKLSNNPQVIEMFKDWGYPDNFHFLIGILELTLAVLLLIPKTLKIATFGLAIVLTGAAITHLINDPIIEIIRPMVFFVFLGGIYYINFYKQNK